MTTGTNRLGEGFDVVVEGNAVRLIDPEVLRPAAVAIDAKYSGTFHWDVADDGTLRERTGEEVIVFRIAQVEVFGFARGDDPFGQTRWRFADG